MRAIVVAMVVACASAACDQETPVTTGPTPAAAPTTRLFTGSLSAGESRFYSFTVTQTGTVSLMLASVTRDGSGPALPAALGLGLGVPSGPDCGLTKSVTTPAGLSAQITDTPLPGIYCARVADVGSLTGPVSFAIRIIHP